MRRRSRLLVALTCLIAGSAGACSMADSIAPAEGGLSDTVHVLAHSPIGALPAIDGGALLTGIQVLASDEYEGRAPGSNGERLTLDYLVEQFEAIGLQPGNTDGSYLQAVPLVGMKTDGTPLIVRGAGHERRVTWGADIVAWTKRVAERVSVVDSEMIFVGYGVVAPEYDWDDFKGLDVEGKTLVMLVNDPPVPRVSEPTGLDPTVFGGSAMTYYGRWTHKFEVAAEKRAAGAIIIHETERAGYPFSVLQAGNLGERFDLVTPDLNMGRAAFEGWITEDEGRALLRLAGQDFGALKASAATREFRPVSLGLTASMTLDSAVRTLDSWNVVARLEGRDPDVTDQHLVYTAHWDHLGSGPAVDGDAIYNGAKDNASGTAGLIEIARAFSRLPTPPRRSILFLAVTGEEHGLLGSEHYSRDPIYPLRDTVANINLDGLNLYGRTADVTLIGPGASDLDDVVRDVAGEQGRVVRPDPDPEVGRYYRSDHFSFAKRGVPTLYLGDGVDFVGRSAEFSQEVRRRYAVRDYHRPSDEVKDDWDLGGAGEDLQVLFAVGYRVAEAEAIPEWSPGLESCRQAPFTVSCSEPVSSARDTQSTRRDR